MLTRRVVSCNLYISEGRNAHLIQAVKDVIDSHQGVALVTSFTDADYHRSSYTIASDSPSALSTAVLAAAQHALRHIDMTCHHATHPRLGAVDHISCHPLTSETPISLAVQTASALANSLSQPPTNLPIFLYGAAHPSDRTLAELRRQLGYFKPTQPPQPRATNGTLEWSGLKQPSSHSTTSHPISSHNTAGLTISHSTSHNASSQSAMSDTISSHSTPTPHIISHSSALPSSSQSSTVTPSLHKSESEDQLLLPIQPEHGPLHMCLRVGVCTIGAVPLIVNYNIPLLTTDLTVSKHIARGVSERGGGLPLVESMALLNGGGIEVACNLLDYRITPPEVVLERVRRLAGKHGVEVGQAYRIGLAPEDVIREAAKKLSWD